MNFEQISGFKPYPFQAIRHDFSKQNVLVLKAPTGAGKTEYYFCNWILDLCEKPKQTPKRLIIQLPLRTLVSQTEKRVKQMVERSNLDVKVYVLQGGQIEDDFIHEPDENIVIIGTLDQIVSRQLMRPYCASWQSAPLHFDKLNNNCRIVIDETQLQDKAYPTAVRLQKFYQTFGGLHARELVLCSATLNDKPIISDRLSYGTIEIGEEDKSHAHFKLKFGREKVLTLLDPLNDTETADLAMEMHKEGTLTLIVCNTVKRAQAIYSAIPHQKLLLTSRFRKGDRESIEASLEGFRGILVSTQVVEAGVDLDARTLISDLCPWSSAVQRGGRAGRNGTYDKCDVIFINTPNNLPYDNNDMVNCWEHLKNLPNFNISTVLENQLFEPVQPCRLTEDNFIELYDTHPREVDVSTSQYIREIDDGNVFVAWRDEPSEDMRFVEKHEICPVTWNDLRNNVDKAWFYEDSTWVEYQLSSLNSPKVGSVAVISTKSGCYDPRIGWSATSRTKVDELPSRSKSTTKQFHVSERLTLTRHLTETKRFIIRLMRKAFIDDRNLINEVSRAGFLHDIGKGFYEFQHTIQNGNVTDDLLAKPVGRCHLKHRIKGLRHEVHSAIACQQMGESDLITYLVMSHHGKVRQRFEKYHYQEESDRLHGIADGDVLPSIDGVFEGITLEFNDNIQKQYKDIAWEILDEYGPFKLSEMESLVRTGDVLSSRLHQIVS